MVRIVVIFLAVAALCYYAGNTGRHPQQHQLIDSDDYIWKSFAQCKLSSDPALSYKIGYTGEVRRMDGKDLVVTGFMVPLEVKQDARHFLLSRRAPSCPFCPPAEPNELVEVIASKPVPWTENLCAVKGKLTLPDDGKKGIFFRLQEAGGM